MASLLPRALLAVTLTLTLPALSAAQTSGGKGRFKVDRALQDAVATSGNPQRVIIRTRENSAGLSRVLRLHGDLVDDVQDDGTITAEIHADDVAALAQSQSVLSLSIDAVVSPSGKGKGKGKRVSKAEQAAAREAAAAERRAAREARRSGRQASAVERQPDVAARRAAARAEREARRAARQAKKNGKPDNGTSGTQGLNQQMARDSGRLVHETLGLGLDAPTGAGVVIAVIDSGIYPLEDFGDRIVASLDCTVADATGCVPVAPSDSYGHGTHVAGLLAGATVGVAPDALLIGVKVLDEDGQGFTSDVIEALRWVKENRALYNIQIANLSLGHPIYESAATDPLVIAVQELVAANVKVVVAGGNFGMSLETGDVGYAGITSPGNAPSAITVGATMIKKSVTRVDDRVADYSSRGPTWYDGFLKPDIVAPGDSLLSFLPPSSTLKQIYLNKGGKEQEDFVPLSGTSMAAAVATGVVATLLETSAANTYGLYGSSLSVDGWSVPVAPISPLSPNLVKAILQYTAIPVFDDKGRIYDPLTQGAGAINAGGAVAVVESIDVSVPATGYWLTGWQSADLFGETTIGGTAYTWTQNIFWGDNIVWGSGIVSTSQLAWSDNIVWGSSYTFLDNIVWGSGWGDNIVWGSLFGGDDIVWGSNVFLDNIVWGSSFGFDNIVWGSGWGDNIVWGSTWGDNIVWGSALAWADNIVWGSNLLGLSWDDNIVWGSDWLDNIVWGSDWLDNIVWGSLFGDNIVWGSDDQEHDGEARYKEKSSPTSFIEQGDGSGDLVSVPVGALAG